MTGLQRPNGEREKSRELTIADLRFDPPHFSPDEIRSIAKRLYGIEGEFHPLAGERDQNHRVISRSGEQFVLKISGHREPADVVEMQVLALRHIEQRDPALPVPRMIRSVDDRHICSVEGNAGTHAVRLLSWLPGLRFQDGPHPSAEGLQGLGRFIARLGLALADFQHPAAAHFMPWNMANGLVLSPQLRGLLSADLGEWLPGYFNRLGNEVFPQLGSLRSQVIHQDGHGANLLRPSPESEKVVGVIDFGDMVHGPLMCDLAACASDFMEPADDPLAVALELCRGFNQCRSLQESELELLLDMVMVRHIMILQLFEFRRRYMESPPSFVIDDQPPVIASLQRLAALDREQFALHLKEAVLHESIS